MFSVLLWHKGKWFCPIWANQWQQVFPDTIFKPLRPTLTLLVCSTKPWLEGGERERLFVFVTWIKSLYVYGMLEGLLFMHYPSMRAIDGRLNSQGQSSNCHRLPVNIRGVTIHVFVPNRHGTGTLVWLQRWTAVRKCGVHSVNSYSDSVIRLHNYGDPSAALRRDVGYAMQFAARSILYVDYKPGNQCCK